MHVVVLGHFLSLLSAQSSDLSLRWPDEYANWHEKPEDTKRPAFCLNVQHSSAIGT